MTKPHSCIKKMAKLVKNVFLQQWGKESAMQLRLWAVVMLCLLVSACSAKDEVHVIREMIRKSAEMAEAKQIGDLMQQTGKGFVAMPGRHNADETGSILFAAFMHYGRFKIHFPKPGIDIAPDGRRATATIYFFIVRQNQPIPGLKELYENPRQWLETASQKADLYQLNIQLAKEDSDWVVMEALLEGFKGLGF